MSSADVIAYVLAAGIGGFVLGFVAGARLIIEPSRLDERTTEEILDDLRAIGCSATALKMQNVGDVIVVNKPKDLGPVEGPGPGY